MTDVSRSNDRREIRLAGAGLVADPAGALYWPAERMLIVADLHLEKGSSFAAKRGMLLPPYDTAATLKELQKVVATYRPRTVVALGDSFHDGEGPARLSPADCELLNSLLVGRDWIWIAGNHDPKPIESFGGQCCETLAVSSLLFRHQPTKADPAGEIAGHLHPVLHLSVRGRGLSRRCFAHDGRRMIMPAFGAYTGGLNIRDRAFAGLFDRENFIAHLLGDRRLYAIGGRKFVN